MTPVDSSTLTQQCPTETMGRIFFSYKILPPNFLKHGSNTKLMEHSSGALTPLSFKQILMNKWYLQFLFRILN